MPPSQSSVAARTHPRKSHRKSRLGCKNCKNRRIKCDEQKPTCTNCIKHSVPCDYSNVTASVTPRLLASRTSTPASNGTGQFSLPDQQVSPQVEKQYGIPTGPSSPAVSRSPFSAAAHGLDAERDLPKFTMAELELLHNYYTSTAQSLSSNPALSHFWRVDVPKLSFGWPFLLHGLFSISAIHLAHFRPGSGDDYLAQAEYHWNVALRGATPLLEAMDGTNCHAVYIFSILASFYYLGKGPKSGDFLVFSDEGTLGTLLIVRGTRVIIESNMDVLKNGPVAVLIDVGSRRIGGLSCPAPGGEHALIQELRFTLTYLENQSSHLEVYEEEINNLSKSYYGVYNERSTGHVSTQVVFVWLYRLSDAFLSCLQRKEPMALTIFAYFIVLLKELDSTWYLQGWVDHLILGIHQSLSPGTRTWIRTPIERIGWIPPW